MVGLRFALVLSVALPCAALAQPIQGGLDACTAPSPALAKVTATPDADPKALREAVSPLGDIVYGRADAPVTVVEYSSLTCAFCAAFHNHTFPKVQAKWIATGKVRWVLREFVGDQVAMAATRLVRCRAGTKAGPYEEGLFRRQTDFVNPVRAVHDPMKALSGLASTWGMDAAAFESCRKDATVGEALVRQRREAEDRFLVLGTPTFFVEGRVLTGDPDIEELADLVAKATTAKPAGPVPDWLKDAKAAERPVKAVERPSIFDAKP